MPSKPYHHGNLQQALLDAAENILENQGLSSLSLRAVAKSAGVSHTAPYRHFKDKMQLMMALAAMGFKRLSQAMIDSVNYAPDNATEQLRTAGLSYVRLATSHPQMTQLMFGGVINTEECSDELQQHASEAFDGLLQIISNGQKEGLYQEQDTQTLALATWSMMHGFSMLHTAGQLGPMDKKDIASIGNQLGEILLLGMKKR